MKLESAIKNAEKLKSVLIENTCGRADLSKFKLVVSESDYKELLEDVGMKYTTEKLTMLGIPIEGRNIPREHYMVLIMEAENESNSD